MGPAGVAYTFWYLSKTLGDEDKQFINMAKDMIAYNLKYIKACNAEFDTKKDKVGFLVGQSGVFAVAAVIAKELGDQSLFEEATKAFHEIASLAEEGVNGSDELLVGRAGFISGCLWLRQVLGQDIVPMTELHKICQAMLKSGINYSKRTRSPSPIMYEYYQTQYLGAAHGLCAILQMLISVPDFPLHDRVQASIDYLLTLQDAHGNFPCAMDELPGSGSRQRPEDQMLVHWCHGSPGMIYLFAKAYRRFQKEEYLTAALRCGDNIWERGLLKKGPGICHGVAGNGYAFLLLFRLTNDPKHLYRAERFAQFMESSEFLQKSRRPDCPFSLYEGLAGTACFLADMIDPSKASFPFLDVMHD